MEFSSPAPQGRPGGGGGGAAGVSLGRPGRPARPGRQRGAGGAAAAGAGGERYMTSFRRCRESLSLVKVGTFKSC